MKTNKYKACLLKVTLLATVCSSAMAADWDFRWVVKNDTYKEIRGVVGTAQYPWDTVLLSNSIFASVPGRSEGQSIQVRKFESLAPFAETQDIPLSHHTFRDEDYSNRWAAHLFYDGKEYYGLATFCNVDMDDIDAMNEPPGGGHVTIQITENRQTHDLAQINIIKPATGSCPMSLVQVEQ